MPTTSMPYLIKEGVNKNGLRFFKPLTTIYTIANLFYSYLYPKKRISIVVKTWKNVSIN
jgi:glycogen synthase